MKRSVATAASAAIPTAGHDTSTSAPSSSVTAAISATAEALTASRKADSQAEARNRGMSGFRIQTKTNDGRKMPSVAAAAPATGFRPAPAATT